MYVGDTISLDMEVTGTKPFSSREDAGLVVLDTEMTNGDGETVFAGDVKFMIARRD
ncbi:hypothetical protein HUG12_13050 [Halorarum salinum]|uniref:MaoC family dehydratase n=1 Tax=Halorarum salinum TaxID=2743089 RepID=A0A7D5QBW9_9EURY|nr:hypothetical protein [Halobaculum salinum]QLG62599.1 hypothetical protein HUG12_13050 [Halobaculum salinum]